MRNRLPVLLQQHVEEGVRRVDVAADDVERANARTELRRREALMRICTSAEPDGSNRRLLTPSQVLYTPEQVKKVCMM